MRSIPGNQNNYYLNNVRTFPMKRMMVLALCGLMLGQQKAIGQNRSCGAEIIRNNIIARDPANAALLAHIREHSFTSAHQSPQAPHANAKTTADVTIPVVFHILLTSGQINQLGGTAGIAQRVYSQIDVINRDYAKRNYDTAFIPAVFKPLASRTNLQFGLAHRKPDGTSTVGFEIVTTTTNSYSINDGYGASSAKHSGQGGVDAWDVSKYLNIWVLNLAPNGILGFTDPPSFLGIPGFPHGELGIVLNYGAFGRRAAATNYYLSGIDRGRTLTHELGHYFALEHVWGPSSSAVCTDDDNIGDTPIQLDENYGYPSFPQISCGNGPNGDMFMNYMDYVNDSAMHLFTIQQAGLINSKVVNGAESYSLTQHPELLEWPTNVAELKDLRAFDIYPNPTTGVFHLATTGATELKQIAIINVLGQTVRNIEVSNSAITNYSIDLTGLNKGVYLVQCNFASGTLTKKIVLQ
jgi:hypothetical protein